MDNLLEETIEKLKENSKQPKDVLWCGSEEYGWFTWEEFVSVADVEYDGGYGAQEAAQDLLIVGKDFWLERHEYDGSGWWEFKTTPEKPRKKVVPKRVIVNGNSVGWKDLAELNSPK